MITNTPFIFIKSRRLSLVQGANEDWVLDQGVGVMAESPEAVAMAVRTVLDDSEIHARIRACQHRGEFDALTEIESDVRD